MSAPSPYRPPEAPVADQDRPRGSPVKGMIFGLLVDIGGSLLAGIVLTFVWAIWLGATGHDAKAIEAALTERPDPTSAFSLIANALGMGFSWLGGYVCARVARETELRCAGVVAGVGVAISPLFGLDLTSPFYLAMVVLGAALVMLGGWMGQQRNARQP